MNVGGLLVGREHKHAQRIAGAIGDNCTIRFLPRHVSASIEDMQGDCLIVEADTEAALSRAEYALTSRWADLNITSANMTGRKGCVSGGTKPPAPQVWSHIYGNTFILISDG